MAQVVWSEPALDQLEAIVECIALDKPEAAKAVAQRIFAAMEKVEVFAKLGRPVPELPHPHYRQIWLKPCWIYYRIENKRVYILHVRRGEHPLHLENLG